MSNEKAFSVKVEGPGVNIEQEVKEGLAKRVIFAVLAGDASSLDEVGEDGRQFREKPNVSGSNDGSASGEPEISIREFLNRHGPKRNVDKITTIALYLRKHEDKRYFTPDELTHWFESAAEPVPANMPRDMRWAVKNGWVTSKSDDDSTYYLTETGRQVVENSFPDEVVKNTASNR